MKLSQIGIGNELDVTLTFQLWEKKPAFKVAEDPFYLRASEGVCELMKVFFDEGGRFAYDVFMEHILKAVETSVNSVFDNQKSPKRLSRKTTNAMFESDDLACRECEEAKVATTRDGKPCKQCTKCVVTGIQFNRINSGFVF